VITHVHFDHLDGLGNAYRLLDHLPVHAADEDDPNLGESVAEHVDSRYHYLDQVAVRPETPFEPFEAAGFEVTLVPGVHPPLSTYGLRIDEPETGASLAISGDTSYAFPRSHATSCAARTWESSRASFTPNSASTTRRAATTTTRTASRAPSGPNT